MREGCAVEAITFHTELERYVVAFGVECWDGLQNAARD